MAAVACCYLHPAHHPRIEERTNDEGCETCHCHLRGKAKHLTERGIAARHYRRKHTRQSAHENHKEVHHEAKPDNEARLAVAPHLSDAVVNDVRDWKHDETTSEVHLSEDMKQFCFEKITCNKTYTKQHAHYDKCQT